MHLFGPALVTAALAAAATRVALSAAVPADLPRIPARLRAAVERESAPAAASIGEGGALRFWPAKRIASAPAGGSAFERTRVAYGFAPGAFVGVLEVSGPDGWTDAKGQRVAPGAYAAVYAIQPILKAHAGTTRIRDVLLLVAPADARLPVDDPARAAEASRRVAGSGHPAVVALATPGDPAPDGAERPFRLDVRTRSGPLALVIYNREGIRN